MTPDGAPGQAQAGRHHPKIEPRTRGLLKALAGLLRSVSPEDADTDILLHDMARQIEAKLDGVRAEEPLPADAAGAWAVGGPGRQGER